MRRPALDIISHEGTMGTEGRHRATIFEGAMAHFIRMLYDAYPNPYEAIPREYGMNARDSHIAAGKAHVPIEVDLPSALKPSLVIRDHGEGMSLEDVEQKFLAFGYSTKQDTDEQVGSLGIGCKCAMTLVNQFTVTAVKNGIRVVAVVMKEEDGVPAIQVLDTAGTQEENGVEIQIPISEIEECNAAARRVFRFWDSGTVLVNGVLNKCILEEGTTLEEDSITLINDDEDVEDHLVIMGGIAYPADIKFIGIGDDVKVVAKVPIGSVDFTLSREKLWSTPATKDTLSDLKGFVEFHYIQRIQDDINAAPTRSEALSRLLEARRVNSSIRTYAFTWNNERFPGTVNVMGWAWPFGYVGYASSRANYLSQETLAKPDLNLIVVNHPVSSVRKETKAAAIARYKGVKNWDNIYFLSQIGRKARLWLEDFEIIEYHDLVPPKVRAPKPKGPRQKKKWGVIGRAGNVTPTDQPLVGHVVYIKRMDHGHRDPWRKWTRETYRAQVALFFDNLKLTVPVTAVVVGESEVKQFLKAYPQAGTLMEFLELRANSIDARLTDDARLWGNRTHVLTSVKPETWLDPMIRRIATRVQACRSPENHRLLEQKKLITAFALELGGKHITFKAPNSGNDFHKLLEAWAKDYPIFQRSYQLGKHEIECINALYHYRKYNRKKDSE